MIEPLVQPVSLPQMYQARTSLSNSNILAWKSAAIVVVPTPDLTKVIIPHKIILVGHFVTVYGGDAEFDALLFDHQIGSNTQSAALFNGGAVGITADYLHRFLTRSNVPPGETDVIANLTIPDSYYNDNYGSNITAVNAGALSEAVGKPLYGRASIAGTLTGGNAANTLTINVLYSIFDPTTGLFV